jgi:capsular polysaccharide biosynthesis protein
MSDEEFSVAALQRRRAEAAARSAGETAPAAGPVPAPAPAEASRTVEPTTPVDASGAIGFMGGGAGGGAGAPPLPPAPGGLPIPFDPWRMVHALVRFLPLVVLAGILGGAAGGAYGWKKFRNSYVSTAQLMRQELPNTFRSSEVGEAFKPRQLNGPTLMSLMKSLPVLERVTAQLTNRLSPRALLGGLTITPERNTDLIRVQYKTETSVTDAVDVLNVYGREVVNLTKDLAAQEASEVNRFLKAELTRVDADLIRFRQELLSYAREQELFDADKELDANLGKLSEIELKLETTRIDYQTVDLRITAIETELAKHSPIAARLQSARDQMSALKEKYADSNPRIAEQLSRIAELEAQLASTTNQTITPPRSAEDGVAVSLYIDLIGLRAQKDILKEQGLRLAPVMTNIQEKLKGLSEKGLEYARLKARLDTLASSRTLIAGRQREAQLFQDSNLGYYRFFDSKAGDVEVSDRKKRLMVAAGAGGFLLAFAVVAFVALRESFDSRLLTRADAVRVTKLPCIGTVPLLKAEDRPTLRTWALRTWLRLQGLLVTGPGRLWVLGFGSANAGEGRSHTLAAFAPAAAERGIPVLAVTNRVPDDATSVMELEAFLTEPLRASARLGDVAWIRVPENWRWDVDRRRRWMGALMAWSGREAVVLVELPPSAEPEALLMAELVPQLLWVVGSGIADGSDTEHHFEGLRHSGVRMVGVLLNRDTRRLGRGGELA